jgi:hypothetical protein
MKDRPSTGDTEVFGKRLEAMALRKEAKKSTGSTGYDHIDPETVSWRKK